MIDCQRASAGFSGGGRTVTSSTAAQDLLERAQRNAAQAVLRVDVLALLGHAQPARDGAARRGEHGFVLRAAAAAHRAAAAVEYRQHHAVPLHRRDERLLRFLQAPARRRDPAVAMAVGVAEHDDLVIAARAQVLAIELVVQQALHDLRRALDVLARLEQRRDVERHGVALRPQVAPLREQQHRQHVIGSVRHAHDVRADRLAAVLAPAMRDRLEHGERAAALRRELADRRLAPLERLLEPARALLVVEREPAAFLQRLADDAPMHERVLPNVDRRHIEAERAHAAQQAAHGEQDRRCGPCWRAGCRP